jgi:DNA-binding MarR family transcriptional regulator
MGEALKRRIAQTRFESPMQEATLNLLVAADYLRSQVEAICAPAGISVGQYNVLRILRGAHPEGHSRAEILRRMLERAPDVTRLVDRLERDGLAERDRDQSDRRLSITRITNKGLNVLKALEPAVQESQREMARRVSRRDCLELSRICERIYDEKS